jgi:hypothetical protein
VYRLATAALAASGMITEILRLIRTQNFRDHAPDLPRW